MNEQTTSSFTSFVRTILINNPSLVDGLVSLLYSIADDIDTVRDSRMISQGKYINTHTFKHRVLEKTMRKVGYQIEDIPDICAQGRADEILQMIDQLDRSQRMDRVSLSRRALPTNSRFEDVTDRSRSHSHS